MKGDHKLAVEICRREGKKIQVSVAQVKEVLRCLREIIREERAQQEKVEQAEKKKFLGALRKMGFKVKDGSEGREIKGLAYKKIGKK